MSKPIEIADTCVNCEGRKYINGWLGRYRKHSRTPSGNVIYVQDTVRMPCPVCNPRKRNDDRKGR